MTGNDPILERICEWAREDRRVRLVVLNGSRGRDDPAVDRFSDYDVSLFVTAVGSFASDNGWYEQFGPVLVRLHETVVVNAEEVPVRQVTYVDGRVTVEFSVFHVRLAQALYASHRIPDWVSLGYRVLLDKDTRSYEFKPVDGHGYIPERPKRAEYEGLINEFWWQATVAAKYLRRGDLLQAKHTLDCVIRYTLLGKLLGWHVQIYRDWHCNPGRLGSRLPELLAPERWEALQATYAGGEVEDNWRSLFALCFFFRKSAQEVGDALGHSYPVQLDASVMSYLVEIRGTP